MNLTTAMKYLVPALLLLVSSCGSGSSGEGRRYDTSKADERVEEIAAEVDAWSRAPTRTAARRHAQAAADLIVGRDGPGLLPGPDGTPLGIVLDAIGDDDCAYDVLGGSWDHPRSRWSELAHAIEAWTTDFNTFPSLPSHPMRVVGWATLAQSATLEQAIEYSGHAAYHVDVTRDALTGRCR